MQLTESGQVPQEFSYKTQDWRRIPQCLLAQVQCICTRAVLQVLPQLRHSIACALNGRQNANGIPFLQYQSQQLDPKYFVLESIIHGTRQGHLTQQTIACICITDVFTSRRMRTLECIMPIDDTLLANLACRCAT